MEVNFRKEGMTLTEQIAKRKLEEEGYTVLKNGSPDFLAVKYVNNLIADFKFVEAKSPRDNLKPAQESYRNILQEAGLKHQIYRVDNSHNPPYITIQEDKLNPKYSKRAEYKAITDLINKFPTLDLTWTDGIKKVWFNLFFTIKNTIDIYEEGENVNRNTANSSRMVRGISNQ